MGALAHISHWIPEDDIKLKNAVEAGASLESLAKGAVQFSRRFTVQELRERWNSLLYDPFVSSKAASIMFEFEHSISSLPLKACKVGNKKEIPLHGKRKSESVRSCYYARRRKMCKEPFNSEDLSFFVAQENENNCLLGDHFGFQQANIDTMHHSLLQIGMFDTVPIVIGHVPQLGLHNMGENDFLSEENITCCKIEETGQLEANCASRIDLDNNDMGNLCVEYGGGQVLNSPISDCGTSFHNLVYSSSLPDMPIWREGISASDLTVTEKDHCIADEFAFDNGDSKNPSTSGFNSIQTDPKMKTHINGFKFSSKEGYLEELPNSLLNFTNDEELNFMDVEGKDVIDKSYYDGLSSLLLNSPSDINEDQILSITEPGVPLDSYFSIPINDTNKDKIILSELFIDPEKIELRNEVICCTLNTEDQEIPLNDDIILPMKTYPSISAVSQKNYRESENRPTFFAKNSLVNKKHNESISCSVIKERKGVEQSYMTSKATCTSSIQHKNVEEETLETELEKHLFNSADLSDEEQVVQNHQDLTPINQNNQDIEMEEVVDNPSKSDHEEFSFEGGDCFVPSYSDVEAMILGMELEPDDQKDQYTEEVSKYNRDDIKRKISRLEQSYHARMQRDIAAHAALAVLYGRHFKHFINKPGVLLGRSTNDIIVDVDLEKEGKANKISRRQAIIKMDDHGNFCLKNLGKCSHFINGKEVATRQSRPLFSDCVIKIREMSFIFETSETCMKKYIENITSNHPN